MSLTIQIDSREKARAIKKIVAEFEKQGVVHYTSKLYVGDYMSLDNPRLIIDRKQNLTEICSNVCQGHERFRGELVRAQEHGIKLIILIEHSNQIKSIDDVAEWNNPRIAKWEKGIREKAGRDKDADIEECISLLKEQKIKHTRPPMTGETLSNIMKTMERKYGCEFRFTDKLHTGQRIIEILGGEQID